MSTELELLPLESEINEALIKDNITEAAIKKLYDDYGELTLKDLNDREGYVLISEARKNVKVTRILAEKVCKKGREKANEISKAWVAKEKELVGKISPLEDKLSVQEKKFEAEQDRIKEEKRRKQEQNLFNRSLELTKMGAQSIDGFLVLEDESVDILVIKDAPDDIYQNDILPPFRVIFDRNETIRIENERIAQEQKDKEEAERKELQAKQEAFEKEQAEFKKQQEEFQKQKDAAEADAKRLKFAQDEKRWHDRLSELKEIGWNGKFAFSNLDNSGYPIFTYNELIELSEEEFVFRRDEYNKSVHDELNKREQKRLADIAEKERIAAEKAVEDERQRVALQKQKDEEESERKRIEEQERLDKANDSQKWVFFTESLNELKFPTMKSKKYREWIATAKDMIDSIKAFR